MEGNEGSFKQLYNMLHLFKSKNYRKALSLLNDLGLNNDDFNSFSIEQAVQNIATCESLLPFIVEVIHEIKLSPFRSLKIAIFCLHIIQRSKSKKTYDQIFAFLHLFQERVRALIRAKKSLNTSNSADVLGTSKQFMDRSAEITEMDLSSIMLERITIPLICFQQKIIACHQLQSGRDKTFSPNEAETWSNINLLRKIVDIGPDIQSLGRYYFKESSAAVIGLMRAINPDIQSIYRKILEYFRKKMATIEVLLQENKMLMGELMEKEKLSEFLMMIEELEFLNEKLRVLYNGRYFIYHLANIYIYLPALFTENQNIDLVYKIKQYHSQQQKRNRSIEISNRKKKGPLLVQVVEDI